MVSIPVDFTVRYGGYPWTFFKPGGYKLKRQIEGNGHHHLVERRKESGIEHSLMGPSQMRGAYRGSN